MRRNRLEDREDGVRLGSRQLAGLVQPPAVRQSQLLRPEHQQGGRLERDGCRAIPLRVGERLFKAPVASFPDQGG
jgi:hypothetical protein